MAQELFDLGNGLAVACNPGGRFHGWVFEKHPLGQWVSIRKLDLVNDPFKHTIPAVVDRPEYNGGDTPPI